LYTTTKEKDVRRFCTLHRYDHLMAIHYTYGKDIVIRKLLITYLSLQLAQSIGIDHHAAKEELYYYMRTKDNETHTMLTEFMGHFYKKVCKDKESGSDIVI
jgi:hypothetical protein